MKSFVVTWVVVFLGKTYSVCEHNHKLVSAAKGSCHARSKCWAFVTMCFLDIYYSNCSIRKQGIFISAKVASFIIRYSVAH